MLLKLFIFTVLVAVPVVHGHGRLWEPIARTSIHLRPEFQTQEPYWWDSSGVWCGNVEQDLRYSTCGRCGDMQGESTANQGGIYDKGVIVATYQSGSVVEMVIDISAPHNGHFELELCPQSTETDTCFQKLQILEATTEVRDGNRVCVTTTAQTHVTARVQLPSGIRCDRCTVRWTYRTSYPPHGPEYGRDYCDNPHNTQTFRNCADVAIM